MVQQVSLLYQFMLVQDSSVWMVRSLQESPCVTSEVAHSATSVDLQRQYRMQHQHKHHSSRLLVLLPKNLEKEIIQQQVSSLHSRVPQRSYPSVEQQDKTYSESEVQHTILTQRITLVRVDYLLYKVLQKHLKSKRRQVVYSPLKAPPKRLYNQITLYLLRLRYLDLVQIQLYLRYDQVLEKQPSVVQLQMSM